MLNNKQTKSMQTRNGARCVYTGFDNKRESFTDERNSETYVKVQILPALPQRFEWVNERNLKGG